MNIAERNARATECMPLVDRIVRKLRIEEGLVADAQQAGYLAVIELLAGANPDNWEAFKHSYIRPRVMREVIRHVQDLRGAFSGVPVDTLTERDTDDNDGEAPGETSWAGEPALIVNNHNEDLTNDMAYDRLLDLITALPERKPRHLMLGVLAGFSVTEAGAELGLTQSAADRLYQKTVTQLRTTAGNSSE
jgi:RNA polymerase sigma factor (sigma-70 family)